MVTSFSEFGLGEIGGTTIPNQTLYPGLSQIIVEYAMPAQVFRQLFVHYPTNGYQSVTIPKEDTPAQVTDDATAAVVASRIGEGDELPLNILPISSSTVTAYKIGEGYQVTREMILFQQIPIIQQRLKRLGLDIGNTIDFDCAAVMSAGATTTTGVNGKTKGIDNTLATEANTIGQYDIVNAKVRQMTNNLYSDTLIVHPKGAGHLMKLPQYKAEMLYGTAGYQHGEIGNVEGLRVLVTKNCGAIAAGTVTDGIAYVVAGTTTATPNPLGQYTPMGYYVEALPIQTTMQDNQRRDAYEVYAISMYAPAVTLGTAIEKLNNATATGS